MRGREGQRLNYFGIIDGTCAMEAQQLCATWFYCEKMWYTNETLFIHATDTVAQWVRVQVLN